MRGVRWHGEGEVMTQSDSDEVGGLIAERDEYRDSRDHCRRDLRFAFDGDAKEGTEERVEVDVEVKECELVARDLAALTPTEDKP
jgi:hypothetical protein